MSVQEFDELVADVRTHGLLHPIIIFEGKILDGWHRYRACLQTETPIRCRPFDGADPAEFVISCNARRRQMSAGQKGMAIIRARAWAPTGRPKKGSEAATIEDMAKAAGVSKRTVQAAKMAERQGIGDDVLAGRVSVFQRRPRKPKPNRHDMPAPVSTDAQADEIETLRRALAEKDVKIRELSDELIAYSDAREEVHTKAAKRLNLQVENDALRVRVAALEERVRGYCMRLGLDVDVEERLHGRQVHA